jgi:hypothetical protein
MKPPHDRRPHPVTGPPPPQRKGYTLSGRCSEKDVASLYMITPGVQDFDYEKHFNAIGKTLFVQSIVRHDRNIH